MGSDIKVRIDGSFEATKSLNDESDTKLSIKGDKKGKIEASLQSSSTAGQGSKSTIEIPSGAKTKITKEGSILSETEMLNEDGSASLKVEISLSKDRGAEAVVTSTKGERIVVKNYDGSEESIMSFIEAENINRAIGEDNRYKGVKNTFKSSTSFYASENSLSRSTDYSEAKTVEIIPMSAWQKFEEVTLFSGKRSITLLLGSADIVIDGERSTMAQNEEYLLPLDIESVDINQTIEDNQTIVAKDGNLSLSSDWNLVSLPVDTNATSSDFNALTIWKFNSEWIKNPETIQSGEGFWVKKDTPETISFTGDSYTQDFSNIAQGWNLLGTGEPLSDATEYGLIWKYNLSSGWIKNPETIQSGEGFWLKK
jgi:archaellum component FlaF (FlaF/FlaG flagellin family)